MQKVKESDDQRKGIEHDRQAGLPEDGEESNREMAEGLEGKTEEQLEEEAEKREDESERKVKEMKEPGDFQISGFFLRSCILRKYNGENIK